MKILSVVGARPQFVKLAPIVHEAIRRGVEHVTVHTGQHYDPMLSDVFFRDLEIPAPVAHLGVGSGSHGRQTGAMLSAMDGVFERERPDWVLVYGDTNSTIAAALAAVKLHLPVAHLEAGLRSFNRRMPEEHNRVLTDHVADLLFAPTRVAMTHLAREGLASRSLMVGDVMTDVLYRVRERVASVIPSMMDEEQIRPGEYFVATIHRAESTDDQDRLRSIVASLASLDLPVVLPAHPRLVARAAEVGINLSDGALRLRPPLSYPELVAVVMHARGVITDSGGLQKEAFLLGTPCTTVRTETEWVETIELGWNELVEPGADLVRSATRARPAPTDEAPYGDGRAAFRVIDSLLNHSSL
ncbi:non-hydrolyzing UDP-N-acetylglucosamine 2-epimerase [Georgenia thermotolerans]|uniref:UDP-N-acetylglucosamine 2-epimerase (Non-hydrolyzing) n=1 Tax=Georgenia thermotolerans TaxID=527326 RepID=A0A7J5USH4_9MICO|nr:UDP-N-acetylglucosamine 2-epimerase (non-hydrolyzing) [Georgenia thermotolerans]KAE8765237.1 UDP-N-acetylglucosamine 2-epimerase (non-hydrolyzing) [Georgenia thermotolerans]